MNKLIEPKISRQFNIYTHEEIMSWKSESKLFKRTPRFDIEYTGLYRYRFVGSLFNSKTITNDPFGVFVSMLLNYGNYEIMGSSSLYYIPKACFDIPNTINSLYDLIMFIRYYENKPIEDIFQIKGRQRRCFEIQILAGFAGFLGCKDFQIYDNKTEKFVSCCITLDNQVYPYQKLIGIMSLDEVIKNCRHVMINIDEINNEESKRINNRKKLEKNFTEVTNFFITYVGLTKEEIDIINEKYSKKTGNYFNLNILYHKTFDTSAVPSYILPVLKLAIEGVNKDGTCSRCWLQDKLKIKGSRHCNIESKILDIKDTQSEKQPEPSAPPADKIENNMYYLSPNNNN